MDNIVQLEGGKTLHLTSNSAREVCLRHSSLSTVKEEKDVDGNIIGLTIDDYHITLEGILNIKMFDSKSQPFKVFKIKKSVKKSNTYLLYSTMLTKASRWIVPMIRRKSETQTSMKFNSYFVNCYVGTEGEGYMNKIYLIYRYSGNLDYKAFEEELQNHKKYENMIDLDHQHVMYVFNMNKEDKFNFNNFKKGKYSEFTETYKHKILNFIINPALTPESEVADTITYGVLYKTDKQRGRIEDLVGQKLYPSEEFYSVPNEHEEIYNGSIEILSKSAIETAREED